MSVEKAEEWARELHKDQMYGQLPYIHHVEQVVSTLKSWGFDSDLVISVAWLHDVVEDCDVGIEEIAQRIDQSVADSVALLSDPSGYPNRKARKEVLYHRFKNAKPSSSKNAAAIVKCADRWANQNETIQTKNFGLLNMYNREFPEFMAVFGTVTLNQVFPTNIWNVMFEQYNLIQQMRWTYVDLQRLSK